MNNNQRKTNYQDKYQREFPYQWFQYCLEPLENIEGWDEMLNDTSDTIWQLHHRDEIKDDAVVRKKELKSRGEYYNLPANKLIFLTESEHKSIHMTGVKNPFFGKHFSEKTRRKLSKSHKGKNFKDSMTPEAFEGWRKKNSESHKGKPAANRKPIEIDGVPYVSRKAAEDALGKSHTTIHNWLKSGKAKYL